MVFKCSRISVTCLSMIAKSNRLRSVPVRFCDGVLVFLFLSTALYRKMRSIALQVKDVRAANLSVKKLFITRQIKP